MAGGATRAWLRLLAPVVLPAVLLLALRAFPGLDLLYHSAAFHLIVVSGIAVCALLVAVAAAVAGARGREHGPVWLASGCVSVGILMLIHGLLTPGVLNNNFDQWVGRSPYLAITLFAVAVALAGRPRNVRTSRLAAALPGPVLALPVVVLGTVMAMVLASPTALAGVRPVPNEEALRWVLTVVDAAIFTLTAVVHWRRWRLGQDVIQYALVLASAMSLAALGSLAVGRVWQLSWWDYHVFLLLGFSGAVYAVIVRYRRTSTVESVLDAVFESDPMVHIVHGYPDALKSLVQAVEHKDSYTHGHSQRTAQVAVQLGLRIGISEEALRAVARGGYLHDVGKIAIPDEILNKPSSLTPGERAVIETHPQIGYELVAPEDALGEALPAVLHHHERWDGTGYPHALAAHEIPLLARVVAIADVWDAMTSDRSYRPGLPPQVALGHIAAGRGTHFDPQLVEAFLALAADWGYHTAAEATDPDEVVWAAASCHEVTTSRA